MNIIMLLLWSLGRGNPVVPSRWQATEEPAWTTPDPVPIAGAGAAGCPEYVFARCQDLPS
jgi:hypothetical protein